jgi:hypothetical protein
VYRVLKEAGAQSAEPGFLTAAAVPKGSENHPRNFKKRRREMAAFSISKAVGLTPMCQPLPWSQTGQLIGCFPVLWSRKFNLTPIDAVP